MARCHSTIRHAPFFRPLADGANALWHKKKQTIALFLRARLNYACLYNTEVFKLGFGDPQGADKGVLEVFREEV